MPTSGKAEKIFQKIISTAEIEQLSGLGSRRLRQLSDSGKIPTPRAGKWQLGPCVRGLIQHYRDASQPDELDAARLEKLLAETAILEMEGAEMDGRLVNFNDALEVLLRGLAAMTSTVMGMTHLSVEDRETVINKLNEAGTMFGAQLKKEITNETKS